MFSTSDESGAPLFLRIMSFGAWSRGSRFIASIIFLALSRVCSGKVYYKASNYMCKVKDLELECERTQT